MDPRAWNGPKGVELTQGRGMDPRAWNGPKGVEWTQGRGIAQRYAETVHARPRLHAACHRSKVLKGEKEDCCAGMAQDQPRSQSNREPVDYY